MRTLPSLLNLQLMNPLADFYSFVGDVLRIATAKPENKPTCSKGCFQCCREPTYARRSEIRYILESMDGMAKAALTTKVEAWLASFLERGFDKTITPSTARSVFPYRAAYLWCPLLATDGTCSVYDRRPLECRLHLVNGDPKDCATDEGRDRQRYLHSAELIELLMQKNMSMMPEGEDAYDHLGIILAEELFGQAFDTHARMIMTKRGDTMELAVTEVEHDKITQRRNDIDKGLARP